MISRYLLLLLFNLPFIIASLVNIVTQYKLGRTNRSKFYTWIALWLIIFLGLLFAEPIYIWLFASGLTASDSLSLFDVVQITAIVMLFYIVNRIRLKLEVIERRLKHLHQELSIKLNDLK
jgi:hypothetical protein